MLISTDILSALEQKIGSAIEHIEQLKQQIDTLKNENRQLRHEQELWRRDLSALVQKFDKIDLSDTEATTTPIAMEKEMAE